MLFCDSTYSLALEKVPKDLVIMFLHISPLLDSGPPEDKVLDHRSKVLDHRYLFPPSAIYIVGTKRMTFDAFMKSAVEQSYLSSPLRCCHSAVNCSGICFL